MADDMRHYDVVVVGAGGAGDPLARALAEDGRRTALIEKGPLGGTCTNRGCTPTKALEASARVAHLTRTAARYGVEVGGEVRVDMRAVQARKRQITDRFRRDTQAQMDGTPGLDLVRGTARFVGPHELEVTTPDGGAPVRLRAEIVVLDTGSRPLVPDIEGLGDVPYLTSDTLLELDEAPEHLVVLGGNYIGLEMAQTFRRFGSRVTVIEAAPHVLPGEDEDVAAEVKRFLLAEGITVASGGKAVRITRSDEGVYVHLEGEDGARTSCAGTHLLVATGRAPNTDALNLEAAGVATDDRGQIRVDERLRTSARHVYAAGDAAGSPQFNHIAYDDFKVLHSQLTGDRERTTEGRLVPYAVYTDPPLGRVGVTEREARESGAQVRIARLPMSEVAHAIEAGEEYGMMKAVVDAESGRILGVAILGIHAPEAMSILQTAILGDLPWMVFTENPFTHPSLADSLGDLFRHWVD